MSDVGDLLELLHGAAGRWRTLRCSTRQWQHMERSRKATERWTAERRGTVMQYAGDPRGTQPEVYEHVQRLWIAKPDRFRQEFDGHISVTHGSLWRSWSPQQGFLTNEHDPEVGIGDPLQSYAAHLDPATLIPQVEIERIDGRTVHVRPREHGDYGPGLPGGADAYVLTLDERGIVVRHESLVDGEVFAVHELVDPVWDEEIPDEVFTLEVPEGEVAVSPRELHARMTVEEAAERATFAVWAVSELPEGRWRLDAHYHPSHRESPEQVTLLYHRFDGRRFLQLVEHAAGGAFPWSRIQDAAQVEVERDGTSVVLQSEQFDVDELQALADALVPV